jgi:asparagine synthase (glutamine-hydrolysing)
VLLSGGVDSSTITYFLSKDGRRIKTYTFGAREDDEELKRARKASKLFKTDYKEYVLDFRDFRILEKIIASWGEPLTNPSFIYSYILYKKVASDGTKVCITGNGMDELLFGYDRGQTKRAVLSKTLSYFYSALSWPDIASIKSTLYKKDSEKLKDILKVPVDYAFTQEIDKLSGLYDGASFLELSYFIGLLLENQHAVTMVGDVSGMLHGVEARSPFLARRLVELAFSLPVEYKAKLFDRRKDKFILKKVMEKRLPDEILYASKMGFGFNVDVLGSMMKDVEYIRGLAEESGLSRILKGEYIASALEKGGKDLLRVYALSSWLKEYGRYLKL